jgi:inosine-uridine nucleoside N-ribohydrolase
MRRALIVPFLLVLLAASCTAQQRHAIGEALVRNVVAFEAAKEFKNHGFPIHDHLVCKAKTSRSDESHVGVACTGTTTKGQHVIVFGTANNIRGNQGHFVGTVDGSTVFDEKCLGC